MIRDKGKKKIREFLKSKNVAVISTLSETEQPMSATVFYSIDDNFNIYFMTHSHSRKAENIARNRKVSLVIGTENLPVTVQIQGEVTKIDDPKEFFSRTDKLTRVFSSVDFIPPLFELPSDLTILYKVTPSWIRWFDYRNPTDSKEVIQVLP